MTIKRRRQVRVRRDLSWAIAAILTVFELLCLSHFGGETAKFLACHSAAEIPLIAEGMGLFIVKPGGEVAAVVRVSQR